MSEKLEEHLELGGVKPGLFEFKPRDFVWDEDNLEGKIIADRANQVLNEYLKRHCPVVYGQGSDGGAWTRQEIRGDTHQASLFQIQPIIQPHECEPDMGEAYRKDMCKVCNAIIKPVKWAKV